jgi:maleamate amidohydrolase
MTARRRAMPVWDDLLTDDERKVYEVFRQPKTLGTRPAILVIDVNYAFVGRKPEHIVESVQDYRTSCGERGWEGVANIQKLLAIGREVSVPIIYTTGTTHSRRGASWASRARDKASQSVLTPAELEHQHIGNTIVEEIGPQPEDLVITKRGASGFFGTSLIRDLNEMDIDTVLVTGTTTSGCVRATVVDAACYSLYVGVVEECCFDRFEISHKVSLLDMHAKYGIVMSLQEMTEYLRTQAQPTPVFRRASEPVGGR